MSVRALALLFTVMLALGWVRPAQAQRGQTADRAAEAHLERATKLFGDGEYRAAIEELRAGYVISPQPRFLYALGQAYRFDHQCGEAVRAYRQFLTYHPARNQVTATEIGIKACADADPASVAPAPVETPPPTTTPPPVTTTPPPAVAVPPPTPAVAPAVVAVERPARRPVYKRWWLWTTVGVIAVGAGLGIGLGIGLTRSSSHFSATIPPIGPGAP